MGDWKLKKKNMHIIQKYKRKLHNIYNLFISYYTVTCILHY